MLESVLALQEERLAKDAARLARALDLVKAARAKLASGQALSIDDLTNLTKETVMTHHSADEIRTLLAPVVARHFTPEESTRMRERRDAVSEEWRGIKSELETVATTGDHTSPQAMDLARRCRLLGREIAGGDPVLLAKLQAYRDEVAADPKLAGLNIFSLNPDTFDFLKKAMANLKSQES